MVRTSATGEHCNGGLLAFLAILLRLLQPEQLLDHRIDEILSCVFNDQTVVPSYPIHLSHNPVAVQYRISCRLIEGTHQRRSFEVPHTPHTKPLLLHPPLLNILCQCCLHILLLRTLNLHHLPGTSADLIPAQINESRHSMRSCDIGRQQPPTL